jgi:hypothetical protein
LNQRSRATLERLAGRLAGHASGSDRHRPVDQHDQNVGLASTDWPDSLQNQDRLSAAEQSRIGPLFDVALGASAVLLLSWLVCFLLCIAFAADLVVP